MSDPGMIKEIMAAVTIPVMAKARIGHFVECQVRITRPTSQIIFLTFFISIDPRSNWCRLH